ncbi:MAG TPA: tetratricopeptide repeat protein [Armatimonadota bacterium]|nr:tetratricopeptide repeat protein [Armatimonadota bacterium]
MSDRVAHAPGHHVSLDVSESDPAVEEARSLLRTGHVDEAIALLEPLTMGESDDCRLFETLGAAYAQKGRLEACVGAFETAVHLNPAQPQTHYNLGQAYLRAGDLESGRRSLSQALRVDPTYGKARDALAKLPPEKEGGAELPRPPSAPLV